MLHFDWQILEVCTYERGKRGSGLRWRSTANAALLVEAIVPAFDRNDVKYMVRGNPTRKNVVGGVGMCSQIYGPLVTHSEEATRTPFTRRPLVASSCLASVP